jgi:hypothetical protein
MIYIVSPSVFDKDDLSRTPNMITCIGSQILENTDLQKRNEATMLGEKMQRHIQTISLSSSTLCSAVIDRKKCRYLYIMTSITKKIETVVLIKLTFLVNSKEENS